MNELFGKFSQVHLVGIGGVGMEALARLLRAKGMRVSGSDAGDSRALSLLRRDGFSVYVGHAERQIDGADLLVYSAAVPEDNVEIVAARRRSITTIGRAELLGELSRGTRALAIAGTHGKTTSASMLAAILRRAGLQPDVLIGGGVEGRTQAELGRGEVLVVEADEFARSFLHLHPDIALVTCVDAEHLDCYGSLEEVQRAFAQFLKRLPFYGCALVGGDGLVAEAVLAEVERSCLSYGLAAHCYYRIIEVELRPWGSQFGLSCDGDRLGEIELQVPGLHNVRNATGAAAVALRLQVDFADIRAALGAFKGVDRRFERKGDVGDICIVDDYAHHPAELAATLATARGHGRRVVAVFQPHLYSRTRDFAADFARELAAADQVVLTEIYASREAPLPGVDAQLIEVALREGGYEQVEYVPEVGALVEYLVGHCRPGDLVLTMGAGDIGEVAEGLVEALGGVLR